MSLLFLVAPLVVVERLTLILGLSIRDSLSSLPSCVWAINGDGAWAAEVMVAGSYDTISHPDVEALVVGGVAVGCDVSGESIKVTSPSSVRLVVCPLELSSSIAWSRSGFKMRGKVSSVDDVLSSSFIIVPLVHALYDRHYPCGGLSHCQSFSRLLVYITTSLLSRCIGLALSPGEAFEAYHPVFPCP